MEATKPLKPPVERVALGDSASLQVVTRVNAEQASKLIMQEPKAEVDGAVRANQFHRTCRGSGDGMQT